MRGFELVASVIAAFFAIGIGVGVLLVIALPALRRRRDAPEIGWDDTYPLQSRRPSGYGEDDGPGWGEPPGSENDDNPPRWPGGTAA